MSATARTSSTWAIGLVIDSAKKARVSGRTAVGPGGRVVLVDEGHLDAPVGERVLQQVDRAAVELTGRDDVLALLGEREQRERDGRLTRGDAGGRDAALERGHALLEHQHGGVRRAAVDVAVAAEGEQVARLAQRGELEGVRLVDRRHGGVLRRPGRESRLDLRRREGAGRGSRAFVHCPGGRAPRPPSCVELLRRRACRGGTMGRWRSSSPPPSWSRCRPPIRRRVLDVRWRLDRPDGRPEYLAGASARRGVRRPRPRARPARRAGGGAASAPRRGGAAGGGRRWGLDDGDTVVPTTTGTRWRRRARGGC